MSTNHRDGTLACWLAEEEGRSVAQAALRISRGGAEGELLNVYTSPGRRGIGLGTALVALALAEARSLGMSRLRLRPTEDSRRLYERAGFRPAGSGMELSL